MENTLIEHRDQLAIAVGIIMFFIALFVLPIVDSFFETSPIKGYCMSIGILLKLIASLAAIDLKFAFGGFLGALIEVILFFIIVKFDDGHISIKKASR